MTTKTKRSPAPVRDATANLLLASLSAADFGRIALELEPIALTLRMVLYEPGEEIEHIYFPTTGCVSMIHGLDDGSVEVGTIGMEGLVGVPVLLRASSEPTRALVQVEGHAYRISSSVFREIVAANEEIQRVLLRYAMALFNQVAQSVACNRLHSLEERCARWLLITHDRVDGDRVQAHAGISLLYAGCPPACSHARRGRIAGPGIHSLFTREHRHHEPRGTRGSIVRLLSGHARRLRLARELRS